MIARTVTVVLVAVSLVACGGAGNLREPRDVLRLPQEAGVVERFPMTRARLAAILPFAATRAGWRVEQVGDDRRPWVLELPWGFNESGIWVRASLVDESDRACTLRVVAMVKNDIDRAEDVEGHTRLLMGWIVVTAQGQLAREEETR